MMVVVVPKVTSIFEDFQQALPWYTRLLIFTSDMMGAYWWAILLFVFVFQWAFRRWLKTPAGACVKPRNIAFSGSNASSSTRCDRVALKR